MIGPMTYERGDFELNLAAAADGDVALLAELRASFMHSLCEQLDLLGRARCDGNWLLAASRLKGLGASFHARELIRLAEEALDGAPGDPAVLRKLDGLYARLSANH